MSVSEYTTEDRNRRVRAEWRHRAKKERQALRHRLEEMYPTVPECVRSDLWNWAWAEGHSAGLHEVELYYRDVAPMLEKVAREGSGAIDDIIERAAAY